MRSTTSVWLVIGLLFALGCSGAASNPTAVDPVTPGFVSQSGADTGASQIVPWGFYQVVIDTESWEVEVVPLRMAQYTVDVVTFLQKPGGNPLNLSFEITDTTHWLDLGEMTVVVTLVHPFPGLDQYTGHDVMGVLVSPGSNAGLYDPTVSYSNGVDEAVLLNPDGYTRWMNPLEFVPNGTILRFVPGWLGSQELGLFTATINGYKYFADLIEATESVKEYYTDPDRVACRGQFKAGYVNKREYQLRFPMDGGVPQIVFQYAVIAHWTEPDNFDPFDLPGSFPPSANADEAIYMEVVDDASTLWYDGDNGGGDVSLALEVFDWGGAYNASGVVGEIGAIIVESQHSLIPGGYAVFSGSDLAATAGPGIDGLSSVVTVEIPGCTPSSLEAGPLMITVESSNPTTFDPGTGDAPTDATLAGYFFYDKLTVANEAPFVDPVTDLSLVVTRVGGTTTIENIELHWTDTNAAEYAVYWDEDPYDNGGVIDIDYTTPVAVVPGSPAVISDFDRNGGYVFAVRARAMAGDQSSETDDSNWALIEMENAGDATDAGNWTVGGNSVYSGRFHPERSASWGTSGTWGWRIRSTFNSAWNCMEMWSALATPQLPDFSTAAEAFIEFGHWYDRCWYPNPPSAPMCYSVHNHPGFTGGGATSAPHEPAGGYDSDRWYDFDIYYNTPDDPPGGLGDEADYIEALNPSLDNFFGAPTVPAVWSGTNMNWVMSRVNTGLLDPSVDYAAVAVGVAWHCRNASEGGGNLYVDDIAVVVY